MFSTFDRGLSLAQHIIGGPVCHIVGITFAVVQCLTRIAKGQALVVKRCLLLTSQLRKQYVGVKHVINPDFGGDLPRNFDIPEFEFDEYGVSGPTRLNPPVDVLSDCDNDDDDEEARLRDRLKQFQIEKRACLRKKRIADLKRMVREEERQLDDLKHLHDDAERENCQLHVRFATSAVSGHAVNSTCKLSDNEDIEKKLSKSMNFTPLDTLLGSAGTGGESVSQNMVS